MKKKRRRIWKPIKKSEPVGRLIFVDAGSKDSGIYKWLPLDVEIRISNQSVKQ